MGEVDYGYYAQVKAERDSLASQVRELTEENARLKAELAQVGEMCKATAQSLQDSENEVEALSQQLASLRQALDDAEIFARHEQGCASRPPYEATCSCGYEQWWEKREKALSSTSPNKAI